MKYYIKIVLLVVFFALNLRSNAQNIEGFKVKTEKGEETISSLLSSTSAFIFFDTECPFVESYSNRISNLTQYLNDKNIAVLLVYTNGKTIKEVQRFLNEAQWKGKLIVDQDHSLAKKLTATKLPEFLLVKKHGGTLKTLYKGAIDDNPQNDKAVKNQYALEAVKMYLHGKNISPSKTPAMGCRIKRF